MSPKATSEVLIGTGTFYLAPTGTAFPADPSAVVAGTWIDIGYTEGGGDGGWAFIVERNIEDIDVAEEDDSIDVMQTKRIVHVQGLVVQTSLENIKEGLGGGTITVVTGPPAYRRLTPSAVSGLDRKAALLRVKAPGTSKTRDVQFPNVVSIGALELAYKKAPEKAKIAMDFRAIKVTGSQPFEILDQT